MTYLAASRSAGGLVAGWITDAGLVRISNQDALFADPAKGLFVVSDGMGSHQAGELASQIVTKVLPALVMRRMAGSRDPAVDGPTAFCESIPELSRRLRDETADKPGLRGIGATVVVLLVVDDLAVLGHLGDSRAYLWREGSLRRLTKDHSVVATLLERNAITPEQAEHHTARGQLSRHVGMEGEAPPDVTSFTLQAGDRILLCTDGLTSMVHDAAIAGVLGRHATPGKAAAALVSLANASGGKDNVTSVVVDWKGRG